MKKRTVIQKNGNDYKKKRNLKKIENKTYRVKRNDEKEIFTRKCRIDKMNSKMKCYANVEKKNAEKTY